MATVLARQVLQGTVTSASVAVPQGSVAATGRATGDVPPDAILALEFDAGKGWASFVVGAPPRVASRFPPGPTSLRIRLVLDLPRPASVGAEITFT